LCILGKSLRLCRTFLVFVFFACEAVKMSWIPFLVLLVSRIPQYGFVAVTTSLPLGIFSSNELKHGKEIETYIPADQGRWKERIPCLNFLASRWCNHPNSGSILVLSASAQDEYENEQLHRGRLPKSLILKRSPQSCMLSAASPHVALVSILERPDVL
jgi:hypothetical protein